MGSRFARIGMRQGETWQFVLYVQDVAGEPRDLTGASIEISAQRLTVDSEPVFTLTTAGGEVSIGDAVAIPSPYAMMGNGTRVQGTLSAEATEALADELLEPDRAERWPLQVKCTTGGIGGTVEFWVEGELQFSPSHLPRREEAGSVVIVKPETNVVVVQTGTPGPAGSGGGSSVAVLYEPQTLDPDQKAQARANIDAEYAGAAAAVGVSLTAAIAASAVAVKAEILDSAPGALDTLNELAAALGDDANFAATVTGLLAGKQPLDAQLTALASLVWVGNGGKVLAVNIAEDGFELVTPAGGGGYTTEDANGTLVTLSPALTDAGNSAHDTDTDENFDADGIYLHRFRERGNTRLTVGRFDGGYWGIRPANNSSSLGFYSSSVYLTGASGSSIVSCGSFLDLSAFNYARTYGHSTGFRLESQSANGANSIGLRLDTLEALTGANAKLLTIERAGVVQAFFSKFGALSVGTMADDDAPPGSFYISTDAGGPVYQDALGTVHVIAFVP